MNKKTFFSIFILLTAVQAEAMSNQKFNRNLSFYVWLVNPLKSFGDLFRVYPDKNYDHAIVSDAQVVSPKKTNIVENQGQSGFLTSSLTLHKQKHQAFYNSVDYRPSAISQEEELKKIAHSKFKEIVINKQKMRDEQRLLEDQK